MSKEVANCLCSDAMMVESVKAELPNCSILSWRQVAAFGHFSLAPSEGKSGANLNPQQHGLDLENEGQDY